MSDKHVLQLFKSMVTDYAFAAPAVSTAFAKDGFITNFNPTPLQLKVLQEEFKPLPLRTLFSVRERENASLDELLARQILHYIEVYGLGMPGLFNLEFDGGKVVPVAYVQGITVAELGRKVRDLLYANAPIKDTKALKEIIDSYRLEFNLGMVKNNEMRVMLFSLGKNAFESGDDAVRYMCYVATDSTLLIKSRKVIKAIKEKRDLFTSHFFRSHQGPLAKVFHRHKNLILAAKTAENRGTINRISRLAKTEHLPLPEAPKKTFIADFCAGRAKSGVGGVIGGLTVRDKFKFLNLVNYKREGNSMDAFIIRNGKVHLEKGRPVLTPGKLEAITLDVLGSLKKDFEHLNKQNILLDAHVDYGLPVSRKQTFGQLPFGTSVTPIGETISSGVYWENAWGARDLDLSGVDPSGHRVGWGQFSGYTDPHIVFSGDVTHAEKGAMEFLTSKVTYKHTYGLFLNIFAGEVGAKAALVVGTKSESHWIEDPIIREVGTLESKGNILGFVKGGKFVVYNCRINNASWSVGGKEAAIVARGLAQFWTVRMLLDALDIPYTTNREADKTYDHDLTYQGFSLDKLEAMLTAK